MYGCDVDLLSFCFTDDWDGTLGNPGKLGLSIVAMIFDGIFLTQHFILYPSGEYSPLHPAGCSQILVVAYGAHFIKNDLNRAERK